MMPPLSIFQQLLMQGRGPGQPPAPQPMPPAQQPAAPKPSRLDGLLRRYDQFATGMTDSSALNPQQRSLMRRQLAMNIGGAIQQGQPIAAGVGQHGANLAAQQEIQLKQREARAEAERQQAVQSVFAQQGGQMPLGGAQADGGEPLTGQRLRMAQRERAVQQYQALLAAGAFEEADKFSEQMSRVFPEVDLTQVNTIGAIQMVDPLTGAPVATYDTTMTDFQGESLALRRQKMAMDAGGGGGPMGPPEIVEVDGERFWRRGNGWERIPSGKGGGAAGADGAPGDSFNDRQRTGADMVRANVYSYVSAATGVPVSELATKSPAEIEELFVQKGKRPLMGPVLGRIPLLSAAANADLTPYAAGAGSGQAMINNPTGPITTPDFQVGERMQPNPAQPVSAQAALVRRALEQAGGGVGNMPAPSRTVTRTGRTKDGRRVVEYSDGTREVQ